MPWCIPISSPHQQYEHPFLNSSVFFLLSTPSLNLPIPQQCIDKCAAAGYRITELDDVTKLNIECTYEGNDGCEDTVYEVIDFSPNEACIGGCSCPNATGFFVKPEENDENKEEEKKEYFLEFWGMDGAVDNNYDFGSMVRIEAGEDGML